MFSIMAFVNISSGEASTLSKSFFINFLVEGKNDKSEVRSGGMKRKPYSTMFVVPSLTYLDSMIQG